MELHSQRTLEGLREVLLSSNSSGPETAYWVYGDITKDNWKNMTIISPGLYDQEYPKTYGHYHTSADETEFYKLISGKGIFLLQKRINDENGILIENKVSEILIVEANIPGEELAIPKEYAHSWSNIGNEPLITFDNWSWGHKDTDYLPIKNMSGMAYYITQDSGNSKLIKNPKYIDTPEPKWLNVSEFNKMFKDKISSVV